MEISVLGPLRVSDDGGVRDVPGAMPRRLLSVLTMSPRQEVSVDRLVEGLWGDSPPDAATATLQSHIARLRRTLPVAETIRTVRGGYVLDIEPEGIDAVRFERAAEQGARLLRDEHYDEAGHTLSLALGLWRGTPYAEFIDAPALAAESERLETLRLDCLERRITADLGRGEGSPPVAELEALVRWYPVRENLWGLLMLALYRAGRQADALSTYQRARAALAEELGIDPGPGLQEMERRVLTQDADLDGPRSFAPLPLSGIRSYALPVALVERDVHLASLHASMDEALAGSGRLVLVHGETGAGKSALVREFAAQIPVAVRVMRGACDPLSSPRPLGPLVDMSSQLGDAVVERLGSADKAGLFEATMRALVAAGPTVLVLEDLHWADESTRDWVRFLARRIDGAPCLVLVTYRDENLDPSNPLRVMLGDVASQASVQRLAVPLLSFEAVATLAAGVDVDPAALHAETGGNAFFVMEVIASGGTHLPETVQDAVLASMQRLSPQARTALEAAAVAGARIEPALLNGISGVTPEAVDECVSAGMLRFEAPVYVFRHELVRQAVLAGITPGRLGALHWQVLERLQTLPIHPKPLARLAEHAEMSGDPQATLQFAIAAGDNAARLESHREAAFQFGRALPFAELLDLEDRIALFAKRGFECDLSDRLHDAIEARRRVVDLLRGMDRDLEFARAMLLLSRSYSTAGEASLAKPLEAEAMSIFERLEPSPDLALAYANRAGTYMTEDNNAGAIEWGQRAITLAGEVGCEEAAIKSLNYMGVAQAATGDPSGEALMRESMRRAEAARRPDLVAHGYANLGYILQCLNRFEEAVVNYEDGMVYCEDHDVHGSLLCIMAELVTLDVDLGRWDDAVLQAENLLYVRVTERVSRAAPLWALALIGARRGDRDNVWALLDEAGEVLRDVQQLQYDAPQAMARAEVHLLEGDRESAAAALRGPYEAALEVGASDHVAQLALWLWRCGALDVVPDLVDGPERLTISGRHRDAAARLELLGKHYPAAWARLDSDAVDDLLLAREGFSRLGAAALVARTDAKLRAVGARVPRGVRSSTSANVGGLTDRELEVLALLDEGLRNAEIADRLFLSQKTVGNHVSAILAKLGASSRLEAVRRARDLSAVS